MKNVAKVAVSIPRDTLSFGSEPLAKIVHFTNKSQRKPAAPAEQLNIFEPTPVEPPPPPPPAAAELSEWGARIAQEYAKEPKPRRDQLKTLVLPALDLLLEHDGPLSASRV